MLVHIRDVSKVKHTYPLLFIEETIYNFLDNIFTKIYQKYRYYRSDFTLMIYLVKNIYSVISRYYTKISNTFAYKVQDIELERGTFDSERSAYKYYLSFKKIYSNRFVTDCFSEYFIQKSLKSKYGLKDLTNFNDTRATWEEMQLYNSRFIKDLKDIQDSDENISSKEEEDEYRVM